MRLIRFEAKNFRSLRKIDLAFDSLTLLIGENDAGKSSVLDLLELCLTNARPDPSDFHMDENGNVIQSIEACLEFALDAHDDVVRQYAVNQRVSMRYTCAYTGGVPTTHYRGEVPVDERLRVSFTGLNAQEQKDLIQQIDPNVPASALTNGKTRGEWFDSHRSSAATQEEWIETPKGWHAHLPRLERYSALDYNAPESLVTKTLKQVYEQAIYEDVNQSDGSTTRQLITPLQDVQKVAGERIQAEVGKLKSYIQQYNRRVKALGYEPRFNFVNSLIPGDFQLDLGRGLHVLSKTGAGTRRRMFMGILDWDRDVALRQASSGENLPAVIRAYDEPDTNLHYEAQRRMYQTITEIVDAENSRVQAILCTHSLTMIDRAPAQSIRLFALADDGCTHVTRLHTNSDPDIEHFLSHMARELGITNSLIFYERCFILIEGPTEENALPVLYRRLYGHSLLEDGIRIINVSGNGAVKEFLKLLNHNRKEFTLVFLDKDAENSSVAKLTAKVLLDTGFDEEFVQQRLHYIGDAEFEDAFEDEDIAHCLCVHWGRPENPWTPTEIASMREAKKFSDELAKQVWLQASATLTKPVFGQKLAEDCLKEKIPQAIKDLFVAAQKIVGIVPSEPDESVTV